MSMSQLSLNPDGKTLATTPDGKQLRAGDCPCDCTQQPPPPPPPACPLWYKWVRCSPPGPPRCVCDAPPVRWQCAYVGGVLQEPPPVGATLAIGNEREPNGYCPAFNGLTNFATCYSYQGDPPVESPPPDPHTTGDPPFFTIAYPDPLQAVTNCNDPQCSADACHYFVELFPCGGNSSDRHVFARLGGLVPVGTTIGVFKIDVGGNTPVCFCIGNHGPPTREQDIPAGSIVIDTDSPRVMGAYLGCCACGASLGNCANVGPFLQWVGLDADGLDMTEVVNCCCGDVVSVDASGSVVVTLSVPGFPETHNIWTVTNVVLYNGQWYYVGTIHEEQGLQDGTILEGNQTFGPPNGQYDLTIDPACANCGCTLQASRYDIRWPFPAALQPFPEEFAIQADCVTRSEFADYTFGFKRTQFQFQMRLVTANGCNDDCGPTGGQPIRAGSPCQGCGKGLLLGEKVM